MNIQGLFNEIISRPWASLTIIFNLILIESLLSVDNAAVVATMVLDLSRSNRKKALSYGIIGAYIFRGICLFLAAFLIKIWWLKVLGGLYLVYLFITYLVKKARGAQKKDEHEKNKKKSWLYNKIVGLVGPLWATVLLVETMDLVFSIDNVFAAVAFTDNIILVWVGVFIGILAMRIVASGFVALMDKYPFLETSAFIVLGILGFKLSASFIQHLNPHLWISEFLSDERSDYLTSILTVSIFLVPIISSFLFDVPKRKKIK